MLDDYLSTNHYYQKKVNLDPERCKLNLERAIRRKQRESEVAIACSHRKGDWCQIRSIPFEELEDFHDRYWDCIGTVSKRVFVAEYLTVEPVRERKKDLNITCHCPREDGSLELICQKSFISVLGVSKHKVLAIGKAKLLNGEQLMKETRGGKRWKRGSIAINEMSNTGSENGSILKSDSKEKNGGGGGGDEDENEDDDDDEEDDDDDESDEDDYSKADDDSDEMSIFQPKIELTESDMHDNNERGKNCIFEPEIDMIEPNDESNGLKSDDDDDDNRSGKINSDDSPLREPEIHLIESNNYNNGNLFEPTIEMTESESILSDNLPEITLQPIGPRRLNSKNSQQQQNQNQQRSEIYIRKNNNQQQPLPHLNRQFNSNVTISTASHSVQQFENANFQQKSNRTSSSPTQYYHHNTIITKISSKSPQLLNNQKSSLSLNQHPQQQQHPQLQQQNHTNLSSYLGPENWKKTIERNVRRLQREKEVVISCTHIAKRFCKIQRIPVEDLIHFHNEYWRCNGIVEERIFLAKYLIVTPRTHRREMTISHRIPCSDGTIYEVCQKSFLSVVGITKHKVQAAARAKMHGQLFKKDGRGGSKVKLTTTTKTTNNRRNIIDDDYKEDFENGNCSNYSNELLPPPLPPIEFNLQISNVVGNYKPDELNGSANNSCSQEFRNTNDDVKIKNEPTDINDDEYDNDDDDDNDNKNDSIDHTSNNFIGTNDGSNGKRNVANKNKKSLSNDNNQMKISKIEQSFIDGKVGYSEMRLKVKEKRFENNLLIKTKKIQRDLNFFKRRCKHLRKDRTNLFKIIYRLRIENNNLMKKNNFVNKIEDKNESV